MRQKLETRPSLIRYLREKEKGSGGLKNNKRLFYSPRSVIDYASLFGCGDAMVTHPGRKKSAHSDTRTRLLKAALTVFMPT